MSATEILKRVAFVLLLATIIILRLLALWEEETNNDG